MITKGLISKNYNRVLVIKDSIINTTNYKNDEYKKLWNGLLQYSKSNGSFDYYYFKSILLIPLGEYNNLDSNYEFSLIGLNEWINASYVIVVSIEKSDDNFFTLTDISKEDEKLFRDHLVIRKKEILPPILS